MRRLALLSAVLGVVALVAGAVIGLVGVEIDVAGETYDCGSSIGRLGGDDAEQKWAEDSFLLNSDTGDIPPDDLPQRACKQETDDQLTFVYILGAVGVVLLLVAIVLFFVGRRQPAAAPPPREPV